MDSGFIAINLPVFLLLSHSESSCGTAGEARSGLKLTAGFVLEATSLMRRRTVLISECLGAFSRLQAVWKTRLFIPFAAF
jgi:hypothetical protein